MTWPMGPPGPLGAEAAALRNRSPRCPTANVCESCWGPVLDEGAPPDSARMVRSRGFSCDWLSMSKGSGFRSPACAPLPDDEDGGSAGAMTRVALAPRAETLLHACDKKRDMPR